MKSSRAQNGESPTQTRLLFIVKEAGSLWLAPQACDRFDEVMVVAQLLEESPVEFAERVTDRVSAIERAGKQIASVRLQLGKSVAPADQAARRSVALGLATHAANYRDIVDLVLERPAGAGSLGRAQLFQLAEELLLATPSGQRLAVRVLLGAHGHQPLARVREASSGRMAARYA